MKITSTANETVKFLKTLENRRARKETGLFLLEGDKLIAEALSCGLELTHLLYDSRERHEALLDRDWGDTALMEASPRVLEKLSSAKTPQGILAAARMLRYDFASLRAEGRYVMLHCIQDPGNLGTIFRTAEALGLDGVLLSADTADVFGPKAVRGAMGSSFRLPFFILEDMAAAILTLREQKLRVYAATLGEDSVSLADCAFGPGSVMLIGNEGNGLPAELCALCDARVKIPMRGPTESLNASVAAAILMWEMGR